MNSQPEYLEVLTFTFGFILIVLYFFADSKNHYKFSDKFTIVECEQNMPLQEELNVNNNIQAATKPTPKAKAKAKAKAPKGRNAARKPSPRPSAGPVAPARNHNGYTKLQQDCFDALKALGIKAVRERKFIVSNTFNKHNPITVQEFLLVALQRGK